LALLATWRLALDDSRAVDGEPFLLATARPAVARMNAATAAASGLTTAVTVAGPRGSVTFPLEVDAAMVDGVVWLPTRAPGQGLAEHLGAGAGDLVDVSVPVPTSVSTAPNLAPEEGAA
jgi:NADH-quinone oxidoreductase subunit G